MNARADLAIVLGIAALVTPSPRTLQNCSERPLVTELGQRITAARVIDGTRRNATVNATAIGVRYMRLRIERTDAGSCDDWLLVLRHDDGRILQTIGASAFGEGTVTWTLRLASDRLRVSLHGCPTGAPRPTDRRWFATATAPCRSPRPERPPGVTRSP